MPGYRKLGRASDQRKALLRNQVTNLLWHGRIETTEARAKEVRKIAEKLITLAVWEYDKTEKVKKEVNNEKLGSGGGYTRILKKGPRRGVGAETVILELVD